MTRPHLVFSRGVFVGVVSRLDYCSFPSGGQRNRFISVPDKEPQSLLDHLICCSLFSTQKNHSHVPPDDLLCTCSPHRRPPVLQQKVPCSLNKVTAASRWVCATLCISVGAGYIWQPRWAVWCSAVAGHIWPRTVRWCSTHVVFCSTV